MSKTLQKLYLLQNAGEPDWDAEFCREFRVCLLSDGNHSSPDSCYAMRVQQNTGKQMTCVSLLPAIKPITTSPERFEVPATATSETDRAVY